MNNGDVAWLGLARPAFAQPYGLRPPASSNAFPINTTESGHRHPCVLCIWKIMRSYLSAVRQDLLVRDSPSAFAKGLCNSVVSLGFLTKSSPETCTILAARRMMSPREATLFRRGSQIERHDVFFITVWPTVPDGPPNRAGTYYRRSRNLPPRPLLKDLPTTN